jgi:DNA-directed RNA polymerase specialized sigma24 family protein
MPILALAAMFDPPSAGVSPLAEVLAAERGKDVRAALGALSEKYRVPLVLAYYNELDYEEIGEILGVERTQVAVLIFIAWKRMFFSRAHCNFNL